MTKLQKFLNNLDLTIAAITSLAWFTAIPAVLFILVPVLTSYRPWIFAGCMVTGGVVFWQGWQRWKCRLSA